MSTFTDLEKDAASVDGFVSENGLIPTRRNGPKPSYQYLVDGWNAEIAATILELNKSRGFRVVGTFADGFTYELFNDVGIDADGNSWIYVGAGAPNKVVPAGTVPSVGAGYEQVTFNAASGVSDASGGSVQDFIDTSKSQGIMPWDADITYPVNGLAKGSDGNIYKSISEQSGNDPVSDLSSNWLPYTSPRQSVDVRDFGAKFDGSDDFPALKRAYETVSLLSSPDRVGEVVISGGVLNCIDLSEFIRIKSNTKIRIESGSSIKVDSSATLFNGISQSGYIFNPIFGAENGVDQLIKNFKVSGEGNFIIEKRGVTPVFIDVINCEKINLFCDVDGIGGQLSNKAEFGYNIRQGIRCNCSGNEIKNTRFNAVKFDSHTRSHVNRNRLVMIGVDARYPFDNPGSAVEGVDFWNASAISMAAQKHCLAKDNDLEITGGAGIVMRSGAGDSLCGRIIDNTMQDIGKGAIGMGLASFAVATTESKGHTIRGNKVYGFQQRLSNSGFDLGADGALGKISNITIEDNYVNMFNELKDHDDTTYPNHADDFGPFSCLTLNAGSGMTDSVENVTIKNFTGKNAQAQSVAVSNVFDLTLCNIKAYNCARVIATGNHGVYKVGALTPYAIFIANCASVSAKNLTAYDSHKGFISGDAPVIFITANQANIISPKVINNVTNGFKSAYALRVGVTTTMPTDKSYLDSSNSVVIVDELTAIGADESTYEVYSNASHNNLVLRRANRPVTSIGLPYTGSSHQNGMHEYFGTNSPEGVVSAPNGAIYRDIIGSGTKDRIYEKRGGAGNNTGWTLL